jgi:hypothetical protein
MTTRTDPTLDEGPVAQCWACPWRAQHRGLPATDAEVAEVYKTLSRQLQAHLVEMHPDATRTLWLSFCGDEGFRGVAVVDVTVTEAATELAYIDREFPNHRPFAEWIGAASKKCWRLKINPGGSIGAGDVSDSPMVADMPRDRLMLKPELLARGLVEEERPDGQDSGTAAEADGAHTGLQSDVQDGQPHAAGDSGEPCTLCAESPVRGEVPGDETE